MKFLHDLICDSHGIPDEAALAFLVSFVLLGAGALMRAFGLPFPLTDFGEAVAMIIPFYKLVRGDWRGPQP